MNEYSLSFPIIEKPDKFENIMTKENVNDYLPFINALREGKTIQSLGLEGEWKDLKDVTFKCSPRFYRIKPDIYKTPFTTSKEFILALNAHGNFITHDGRYFISPCYIDDNYVDYQYKYRETMTYHHLSYESLMNNGWKFFDGTPCCIIETKNLQ